MDTHLAPRQINILERGRVLPPAYASRAVDGAHRTTGVAVPSTMGHALGACVGVDPVPVGNRRDGGSSAGGRARRIH